MKITILWAPLSGYAVAFFRELRRHCGCEIQLVYQPVIQEAPYEHFDLSFCCTSYEYSPEKKRNLEELCTRFEPDCVLISSWSYPQYMRTARKLKRRGSYVISVMDNQWRGSLKQWMGIVSSPWFLKPSIDTFLVAGDRQAYFARKLGYKDVMYGCYAADTDSFKCKKPLNRRDQNFFFIGRLNKSKGIDLLINAYQLYWDTAKHPWGLLVAGTGKLVSQIKGVPGIKYLGFVPPKNLPSIMETVRCLVLPSRFEPWGVVIHEACAAGLPIIATYSCGATTAFVRDGVNGYIIPPNVEKLTYAMRSISELEEEELSAMGNASSRLASLWSPKILAKYFCSNVKVRCKKNVYNTKK